MNAARTEPDHPGRASHQAVPEVVTHLMPKMPQQGTVGFVQGLADGFALGIIGFIHVQGDEAGVVTRHDMWAIGRRAQEIKHEPAFGVFTDSGSHR